MLLTLEKMWTYGGDQRGRLVTNNIMNLMLTIMKPVALFLVTKPLDNNPSLHAAAPFNLYEFQEGSAESALAQLKRLFSEAIAQFPEAAEGPLRGVQRAVDNLIDISTL